MTCDDLRRDCAALKGHPALSTRGHRAIDAALVILTRGVSPKDTSDNGMAAVA